MIFCSTCSSISTYVSKEVPLSHHFDPPSNLQHTPRVILSASCLCLPFNNPKNNIIRITLTTLIKFTDYIASEGQGERDEEETMEVINMHHWVSIPSSGRWSCSSVMVLRASSILASIRHRLKQILARHSWAWVAYAPKVASLMSCLSSWLFLSR